MLISISCKVLCKVFLNRIDKQVDTKLREEQAGFRVGRGCIFTLRTVIEQPAEFNKIWRQEKIPMDWFKGVIIKLPKKGDLMNCDN